MVVTGALRYSNALWVNIMIILLIRLELNSIGKKEGLIDTLNYFIVYRAALKY
jgi:hypothetical protein